MEKVVYSLLMLFIAFVVTQGQGRIGNFLTPHTPSSISCYSCSGSVDECAAKNDTVLCPAYDGTDYTPEQLSGYRCMVTFNQIDRSVYQGCTAQCTPHANAIYRRVCSSRPTGNCIDKQCVEGRHDDGLMKSGGLTATAMIVETLALLLGTAIVAFFTNSGHHEL